MPLVARRRALRKVRLVMAVLVPLGLVLSVITSAVDADQQRQRAEDRTASRLAVTAQQLVARVDTQVRLARTSAAILTPVPGTTHADGAASWESHLRVLGALGGTDGDGRPVTGAVAWVPAASDPTGGSGPVRLVPAGRAGAGDVQVERQVRFGLPSVTDRLVAGQAAPAGLPQVADALAAARDTGGPVLSAPYDGSPLGVRGTARPTGPEVAVAVPVFDGSGLPAGAGGRHGHLLGWTLTTFRVAPLLDGVATRPGDLTVVRDGGAVLGTLVGGEAADRTVTDHAATTLAVPVGGRTWTLLAVPPDPTGLLPAALAGPLGRLPLAWFPLAAGVLLTALVVGLVAARAASEVRAVEVAADRTRALAARTRDLESITRNTPDALARVDADARLRFVNAAMREAAHVTDADVGSTLAELAGRSVIADATRALAHHMLALGADPAADPDADPRRLISMSAHTDGRWYEVRAVPESGPDGSVESVLVVARDVTRFREAQDRLTHAATHDPLTGLANRDVARERAVAALATSRAGTALLLLDLDRFKLVNDSYGHAVGDRLLQSAATRVAADLPDRATAARLGGDEFVVLLPDATPAVAEAVALRLVAAFDEPFTLHDEEFAVGCSVGVVHAEPGQLPWDELLRSADVAMYRAKAAGGGCHQWYQEHGADQARQRLTMAADLRRASEEGELSLVYQAEVDLVTGRVEGVEALMRWTSRTRGFVSPGEFIPVAEETGLIGDLGAWALDQALGEVVAHNRATGSDLRVWVNVSPRQFGPGQDRADLVTLVADLLTRHDAPAGWLGIEVTESALADDARAVPMLRALREIGVGVAIDDFGTGYSSLSRLHDYPVTLLKIDMSFVAELGKPGAAGPRAAGVVEAVVALGRSLGADVIAEGVEDEPRYTALRSLGCDLAQGYLFGRPCAFADAVRPVEVPGPVLPGMVGARPPGPR
jgi:diguanylate cyclase (GGDEF)-like protein